ncbi:MAG: cytochrome B6 [Nitrospirae bacterium]|nr:cytochrome B6 [Candidatus Troglogloeales bacterium]MBI3598421.1 cytochrome B6 [Candidatus Troglogloeales bacterium]
MEISALIKKTAAETRSPEDTALVWPNLVYIELISILLATAVLLFLSLVSPAPLEELASADTTPNPTKAPWYFLGLQELLVYFDPWLAGVVLPSMIIVGLIVIPYVDPNPNGKGYYTFSERKFSVLGFTFGLALWYILIVIGVWFRGLDWSWYWPWSDSSIHMSVTAVKLVDLELIIQNMFGLSADPVMTLGRYAPTVSNIITVLLFLGYYAVGFTIPFLLLRNFFNQLGMIRYNLVMFFFLSMCGVPLKMFLRLIFNIKYLLVTPWFKI